MVMTARPLHQQYIIYKGSGTPGGGGSDPDPAEFCPTNGYILPEDCPIPDPAVFCPVNGYIKDPAVYVPPTIIPEPTTTESITFVCNAAVANWRCETDRFKFVKAGASPYKYELFDGVGNLLDSWSNQLQFMNFDFPFNDRYYTVRVSLQSPSYFTLWYNNDALLTSHNSCIEAVFINCPTGFLSFTVKGNNNILSVELTDDTIANCNSIGYAFDACPKIQYWQPKYSAFLNLNQTHYSFRNSGLKYIDLSELLTTTLTITDNLFRDCKYLIEVIMPSNWSGKRLNSMFQGTIRLAKLTLPDTWITNTGTHDTNIDLFISNSGIEGELVIQEITGVNRFFSFAENCPNLEILRLKGVYNFSTTGGQRIIHSCPKIRIFEAPRSVGSAVLSGFPFDTTNVLLEEYLGPDIGYMGVPVANSPLKSITGDHDNSDSTTHVTSVIIPTGANVRSNLSVLQMKKLRVQRFVCGTNVATKFAILTSLEIDWENSNWASTSTPQLSISAAIDATEINRILTALPSVSSKTADLRYCDGYATCDKTIATAKGWTML